MCLRRHASACPGSRLTNSQVGRLPASRKNDDVLVGGSGNLPFDLEAGGIVGQAGLGDPSGWHTATMPRFSASACQPIARAVHLHPRDVSGSGCQQSSSIKSSLRLKVLRHWRTRAVATGIVVTSSFLRVKEAQGAENLWLLRLVIVVDLAQPIFIPERDDQLGEDRIASAALSWRFSVSMAAWRPADSGRFVTGFQERPGLEHCPLDGVRIPLEKLIDPEPGAGWAAQLSADRSSPRRQVFDPTPDELAMLAVPGDGGVSGGHSAACRIARLRFGHAPSVLVDPRQRVGAVSRAHVEQDARRPFPVILRRRGSSTRRSEARGQPFWQCRIPVDGVLPDLVGEGSEVYLGVSVAIEKARLLVVEINERVVVGVIFEERFVGSDYLGVLLKTPAHASAELDDPLDTIGRQEREHEDSCRSWPMRSTRPARWISRMMAQGGRN